MDLGNEEIRAIEIKFKNFDGVKDVPKDHYYREKNKTGKVSESTSMNIMKEWKVLKNNLPDTIYIQVYEDRIDLLRAVIIGPVGTPYHDGLFFFDIFLPSDYPNHPPNVYYHSFGYNLNPNLYATGKVCLSLINTWYGRKDEKWKKKESTILQVLVSIQGLVLTERPYFNEPAYGAAKTSTSAAWINSSNKYSENTFIFSCQTMLQIMKKPPIGFARFVAWHFKERSSLILDAVSSYQAGRRVPCGMYQVNGECLSSYSVKVSELFKKNVKIIRGQLATAFDNIGNLEKLGEQEEANVDVLKKRMEDETLKKTQNGESGKDGSNKKTEKHEKKGKTGLWGKLVGIVKCIF